MTVSGHECRRRRTDHDARGASGRRGQTGPGTDAGTDIDPAMIGGRWIQGWTREEGERGGRASQAKTLASGHGISRHDGSTQGARGVRPVMVAWPTACCDRTVPCDASLHGLFRPATSQGPKSGGSWRSPARDGWLEGPRPLTRIDENTRSREAEPQPGMRMSKKGQRSGPGPGGGDGRQATARHTSVIRRFKGEIASSRGTLQSRGLAVSSCGMPLEGARV
ncbi:uncharacterized protein VDAG_01340 [Verticillium dahliae VdLs.17]|uniref:Uncharacterized protein n=1 Tax=Verticillium dahliae (strain VdLs.17 / ATCC MYA-4575 / FGSC 10137) TaxID=498257 RepID=G2WU67_VERDV|nr:uncharacterized protein VDAG_01340 [Verticillium dahliae VdLs.17]EGY17658.1 hypothetical protein VDAG_01340 [Verticillium dahliae VdLs.17]